ncbi:unnamed protein product [Schistosoma mattheei]|uniref:Uncharacterized protein n=1 Tax=Schistosoma mattheei TaxID=31246 RepID=A0A3P7ZXX3_9TREM|nr:unnamed protein product [Schistosoma mattheei]
MVNFFSSNTILLTCCGSAINGPYALVTTAVSADLGTQSALLGRTRALATITSIIDGMGSLGKLKVPDTSYIDQLPKYLKFQCFILIIIYYYTVLSPNTLVRPKMGRVNSPSPNALT